MAGAGKGGVGRALLASVVVMGVLIVAGVAVLGLTIVRRVVTPSAVLVAAALDEPPGTRMMGVSAVGDRLALLLQGGGADRLLLIDGRTGSVVGRITLKAAQ